MTTKPEKKSAVDEIRERQSERAQDILSLLPDADAIDVRLWGKDQRESGYEAGREDGEAKAKREDQTTGVVAGTVVVGCIGLLAMAITELFVWPWPLSPPTPPTCDAAISAAVKEATTKVVAGGTSVSIPWRATYEYNSTTPSSTQAAMTNSLSCVRESRTGAFLCVPAVEQRTDLPIVPDGVTP